MANDITTKFKKELTKLGLYDNNNKIVNEVLLNEYYKLKETNVLSQELHKLLYLLVENYVRMWNIKPELNFKDVITETYIKLIETFEKFNPDRQTKDKNGNILPPNPFAFLTSVARNQIFTICNKYTKNKFNQNLLTYENGEYQVKNPEDKEFDDMIKLNKKLRSKKK